MYDGKRLGNGFVASHVWRSVDTGGDAAKLGWTNTFVPNLVWLPVQLAKLTDREGSFTQSYLQALAYKLYRNVPVPTGLQPVVESAWRRLPQPESVPEQGLPGTEDVSFFKETDQLIDRRIKVISQTRDALASLAASDLAVLSPSRYAKGLAQLRPRQVEPLCRRLSAYLEAMVA